MKLRKPKIKFTNNMIENQVIYDLIAFQKNIKKQIKWPIDLEFFVKSLWGIEVEYKDRLTHPESGEEIVGCLSVKGKKIKINLFSNESDGRVNFTTSHEAGHASLHSTLSLTSSTNEITDIIFCRKFDQYQKQSNAWRLEQQANHYACNLLLPKSKLLEEINCDQVVDLNVVADGLMNRFGVSRQALELRLYKLEFRTINNKYSYR